MAPRISSTARSISVRSRGSNSSPTDLDAASASSGVVPLARATRSKAEPLVASVGRGRVHSRGARFNSCCRNAWQPPAGKPHRPSILVAGPKAPPQSTLSGVSATEPGRRPRRRPPLTLAEARAKEERRVRSLQVSTFCLHSMAWILVTFYTTDYLPPLAIRFTVGVRQTALAQYLVGYLVLGLLCFLLATGFGGLYGPRIRNSRFAWRWFVFPVALALLLIPAQGANELLT